jgi:hypothetical protein
LPDDAKAASLLVFPASSAIGQTTEKGAAQLVLTAGFQTQFQEAVKTFARIRGPLVGR